MTTRRPPRLASRIVVRRAALKLERLVVVISMRLLGVTWKRAASIDTRQPWLPGLNPDTYSQQVLPYCMVTTTRGRRERQEWNPDLGVLASRLLASLEEELSAELAAAGYGDLDPRHFAVTSYLDEDGLRA